MENSILSDSLSPNDNEIIFSNDYYLNTVIESLYKDENIPAVRRSYFVVISPNNTPPPNMPSQQSMSRSIRLVRESPIVMEQSPLNIVINNLYKDNSTKIVLGNIRELNFSSNVLSNLFQNFSNNSNNIDDVKLPMKQDAFNKLPKYKYNINNQIDCGICINNINVDDDVIELPCKHIYHDECITGWLTKYNHICPVCRKDTGEYYADIKN